jgi:hypothetical protein
VPLALTAHDVSVAVFVRGLANLKSVLTKGEAHASAHGMDPLELLQAQLAHDMYSLAIRVQWAADGARLSAGHLIGATPSPAADEAKTFAQLYARIDATIEYLGTLRAEDLEAGLTRKIELNHRGKSTAFAGAQFLLEFAIPNFFFHITTAYGILRQKGVQVTKGDFTGVSFG